MDGASRQPPSSSHAPEAANTRRRVFTVVEPDPLLEGSRALDTTLFDEWSRRQGQGEAPIADGTSPADVDMADAPSAALDASESSNGGGGGGGDGDGDSRSNGTAGLDGASAKGNTVRSGFAMRPGTVRPATAAGNESLGDLYDMLDQDAAEHKRKFAPSRVLGAGGSAAADAPVTVIRAPPPPMAPPNVGGGSIAWTKKRFRYMVKGSAGAVPAPSSSSSASSSSSSKRAPQKPRDEALVLECAPEYDLAKYPTRVLVANHIRRPEPPGSTGPLLDRRTGKPMSPYTYEFLLYRDVSCLVRDVVRDLPRSERTLFAVIEENGEVFVYFDVEIPRPAIDPSRHGSGDLLELVGYGLALVRELLTDVLGTNLACWSDSYLVYDSSDASKLSAHAHVAWPFCNVAALRDAMKVVNDRLRSMSDARLAAARPLFYLRADKAGRIEWDSYVDMRVYTRKRNFRLPLCTKRERDAHLRRVNASVPRWNRDEAMAPPEARAAPAAEGGRRPASDDPPPPPPPPPCAAKVRQEADEVSSGLVLCRNSRVFWNPITVRRASLLATASSGAVGAMVPRAGDFRHVPALGEVKTQAERLRKLRDAGASALELRDVEAVLDAFMQVYYQESWTELSRPFDQPADGGSGAATGGGGGGEAESARSAGGASASPAHFVDLLREVRSWLTGRADRLACFMLLWAHVYRPGLGLDQRARVPKGQAKAGAPVAAAAAAPPGEAHEARPGEPEAWPPEVELSVVELVYVACQQIERAVVIRANIADAFLAVFRFHERAAHATSRTCDARQARARLAFCEDLKRDFVQNFLAARVMPNTYTRAHLLDVFVLDRLARGLLTCTGFAVHAMQRPAPVAGGPTLVPRLPTEQPRERLDAAYAYCLQTSLEREGRQEAPPVVLLAGGAADASRDEGLRAIEASAYGFAMATR